MDWLIYAVDYSETIGLGTILLGALVALTGLAVLFYGVRWKSAYAVASTQAEELRKALNDERERAERAEGRERESLKLLAEQKRTIARLESLPDLSKILEFLGRQEDTAAKRTADALSVVDQLLTAHEERAVERHDGQIAVLSGLAANMERLVKSIPGGA
jgi:hypothetical protein